MTRIISTSICFSFLISFGYGQDLSFSRFTKEDGLPGNRVRCFLKDDQGFMWIGTSQGLCRYDGYEFKHYTSKSGFPTADDYVRCLFQDSEGLIWIGTNLGGAVAMNPKTDATEIFKHNPNDLNSIAGDRINIITEDEQGLIWIGLANGMGISKIDKQSGRIINFDPFQTVDKLGPKGVHNILFDPWRPDTVWIPSTAGLITYDKRKEVFSVIDHPLGAVEKDGLFDADQINRDQILGAFFHAGTDIFNIDKGAWEGNYTALNDEIRILDVVRKSNSEYWLAARKKGLGILDLVSSQISFVPSNFKNSESPLPGFTYSVFADQDQLWVGGINGISFYAGRQPIFPFDSLQFDRKEYGIVLCASGSFDKIYLAGAFGAGLWEMDKKSDAKTIITIANAKKKIIKGMLELEDKIILVSRWAIDVVNKKTKAASSINMSPIETNFNIESIHPWTNKHALILTRYGGAFKMSLETLTVSPLFSHIGKDIPKLNDIHISEEGKIWIATDVDIVIFNPKDGSIAHYKPTSLPSRQNQRILSIEADESGTIWTGTSNGLIKIVDGEETLFNRANSNLDSDLISEIVVAPSGELWLGTDAGISRLNVATNGVINYDKSDGVEFSGALEVIDDKILVGSYSGYSMFDPDSLHLKTIPPNAYLADFEVSNSDFHLTNQLNYIESLDLDYDQNFFSFSFTAPSFYNSDKIQFAHQLVGLDEGWIISNRRFANYTNLDGGTYIFQVKARYPGEDWGVSKTIKLHLASPFWETWWFYLTCVAAGLALIIVAYNIRVRTIQRKADMEAQLLQLEALQKRLLDMNLNPFEKQLDMEKLNRSLKEPLSEREFEVLHLTLEEATNADIGERLHISKSTVKFHLRNTYKKLGVRNRKEALIFVNKTSE
ncbi:MAG: two-component regulator propeller domain-containing protein [Bacteroidota bacterium]